MRPLCTLCALLDCSAALADEFSRRCLSGEDEHGQNRGSYSPFGKSAKNRNQLLGRLAAGSSPITAAAPSSTNSRLVGSGTTVRSRIT